MSDPLVGQIVDGRYHILELLSEGGMGSVYVAEHLKLRKRVAFKVVRAELAGNTEIALRLAQEAMATAVIDHPNVVSALDCGTLPDRGAYLVMQLVQGSSLHQVLEQHGSLHWSRAADLGAQIADALSAAKQHGIVHRDLKPDNMVIQTREGGAETVKILDFGVARWTRESLRVPPPDTTVRRAGPVTRSGTVIGTPGYMAPEQALGEAAAHTADLYALGVIVWEMVAGQHPFGTEDLREIVQRQLTVPIPSLRETTGDLTIPEELDQLVQRLCAAAEQDRPQDAVAVRDVLRRLVNRAVANAPPSSLEREAMGASSDSPAVRTPVDATGTRLRLDATGSRLRIERPPLHSPRTSEQTPIASESASRQLTIAGRPARLLGYGMALSLVVAGAVIFSYRTGMIPGAERERSVRMVDPEFEPGEMASAASSESAAASTPQPAGARGPASANSTADDPASPEALLADADAGTQREAQASQAGYEDVLRRSRLHAARLSAAEALWMMHQEHGAEITPGMLALVHLQLESGCDAVARAADVLLAERDPRTLPAIALLSEHPEAVCGPAQSAECTECLAPRLAQALPMLRITAGATQRP